MLGHYWPTNKTFFADGPMMAAFYALLLNERSPALSSVIVPLKVFYKQYGPRLDFSTWRSLSAYDLDPYRFHARKKINTVKPVLSGHSKGRPKIGFQDRLLLNVGQKYCRMLQESILQYFRPSLSYHLSLRRLFCVFLNDRLRHVLL